MCCLAVVNNGVINICAITAVDIAMCSMRCAGMYICITFLNTYVSAGPGCRLLKFYGCRSTYDQKLA